MPLSCKGSNKNRAGILLFSAIFGMSLPMVILFFEVWFLRREVELMWEQQLEIQSQAAARMDSLEMRCHMKCRR